jgi:hypothetical protein
MCRNEERQVAQNLRAEPVAQTDIFEPNQAQLRSMGDPTENRDPAARPGRNGCAAFMVSDSLTVAL